MFLIIIASPFFFFKSKNTKSGNVEYVVTGKVMEEAEKIRLIETINGKKEPYFFEFNDNTRNEAYFIKDTIDVRLIAGFLSGYNLTIKVVGDKFTSKLVNYDCMWREELKIRNFTLKSENMQLEDVGKLKGIIYCKGHHLNKYHRERIEKVIIEGSFEMDLVDVSKIPRYDLN